MPYWGADDYAIYFVTNKQRIRLPVNPTEVTVTQDGEASTYNVIGLGEIIIPRRKKLITIGFSSFFPRNTYLPLTTEESWHTPEDYVAFFTSLLTKGTVFEVVLHRYDEISQAYDTTFNAIVKSFNFTDKGGEPGDIYFDLQISEYRDSTPQKVEKIAEADDKSILTITPQRTTPEDEFVVGDKVTITGPVYETDDAPDAKIDPEGALGKIKSNLNRYTATVSRVLPPSALPTFDRIYCAEIGGWVSKTSCAKANIQNVAQRATNITR